MDGMIPPNPHLKPLDYLNPEPVAPENSMRMYYERFALELDEQDWNPDPTPTYSYVWNQHNMRHHSLIPPLSCIQSGTNILSLTPPLSCIQSGTNIPSLIPPLSCIQSGTNIPSNYPQQMNTETTNNQQTDEQTETAAHDNYNNSCYNNADDSFYSQPLSTSSYYSQEFDKKLET